MTESSNRLETPIVRSVQPEIAVLSYDRNAVQHGSILLFLLLRYLAYPDSQIALSQHLADETRHAWLWTERIVRAGAKPFVVCDGYQTRMGRAAGMPRDVID